MKSEVYSWRVSSDIKTSLEREARRRKISVSAALDLAAREWLHTNGVENEGAEGQRQLHEAAAKWVGALASGNKHRSENASKSVRERLRRRHGR